MFTGLITHQGQIVSSEQQGEGLDLYVECNPIFENVELGESLAVNGVCLTLASIEQSAPGLLHFHLSPETIQKTTLASLPKNSWVNLERALRLGDRLGGHWVQGHVDGIAKLIAIDQKGEDWVLRVQYPAEFKKFFIPKGSVCLDGISLTVNHLIDAENSIELMIIPHTWKATNLQKAQINQQLNLEVDVLGKYMQRMLETSQDSHERV